MSNFQDALDKSNKEHRMVKRVCKIVKD